MWMKIYMRIKKTVNTIIKILWVYFNKLTKIKILIFLMMKKKLRLVKKTIKKNN
jgi:hypothetical protein